MKIKEIALHLNISIATVSRFFNHPHLINRQLRDRIQQYLNENAYESNPLAQQLAQKRKGKIALVYQPSQDLFSYQRFSSFYFLLIQDLNQYPFKLCLLESLPNQQQRKLYDAIIVFGHCHFDQCQPSDYLILPQSLPQATNQNYIYVDHQKGGEELASLFIPASQQPPLVLLPNYLRSSPIAQALKGFKKKLKQYLVAHNPHLFLKGANSFESAMDLTQTAFELGLDFHSIITFTQEAALGTIATIRREDLNYPFDIQIINYSHPKEFYFTEHMVTCMSEPFAQILEQIPKIIQNETLQLNLEPILMPGGTY